jgi:hypothetical protein
VTDLCAVCTAAACMLFVCTPAVTPPGHYTANGVTQPCSPGSFRGDWVAAGLGRECTPCGDNIQLDMSGSISVFDPVSGNATRLIVATSQEDCCE